MNLHVEENAGIESRKNSQYSLLGRDRLRRMYLEGAESELWPRSCFSAHSRRPRPVTRQLRGLLLRLHSDNPEMRKQLSKKCVEICKIQLLPLSNVWPPFLIFPKLTFKALPPLPLSSLDGHYENYEVH